MIKYFFTLVFLLMFSTSMSFAQTGYGAEINGNLVFPIGKSASDYTFGPGVLIGFYYDMSDNLRLALILGYLRVELNEDKINGTFPSGGTTETINLSGGSAAIPAIFSLRLLSPDRGIRFYGLLEGGLYSYATSISGTYTIGTRTTLIDESEFRSEPGFVFGGGMLFKLNKELSLDLNVRYHWIRDSEYLSYGSGNSLANSRLISLGIGLNWFFTLE